MDVPFPCPREWLTQVPDWAPTTMGVAARTTGPDTGRVAVVFQDSRMRVEHRPDFKFPTAAGNDSDFYGMTSQVFAGTEAGHGAELDFGDGLPPLRVGVLPFGPHTDFSLPLMAARRERFLTNNDPNRQAAYGRIVDHEVRPPGGAPYRLGVFIGSLRPGLTAAQVAQAVTSGVSGEWVPTTVGASHWGPVLVNRQAVQPHAGDRSFAIAAAVDECADCAPGYVLTETESGAYVCQIKEPDMNPLTPVAAADGAMINPETQTLAAPQTQQTASSGNAELAGLRADMAQYAQAVESLTETVEANFKDATNRIEQVSKETLDLQADRLGRDDAISTASIMAELQALRDLVETLQSANSAAEADTSTSVL